MNIRRLMELRSTDDDPWTPGEFNAVLRYLLSDTHGNGPVSQTEIVDAIAALLAASEIAHCHMWSDREPAT